MSLVSRTPPAPQLTRAFEAISSRLRLSQFGSVGYYASPARGEAPNVVLLHDLHFGASSADMRPLFESFTDRRVFAFDWPGFGLSERGDRRYSPDFYARTLQEFLRTVAAPDGAPVDVIAQGVAAEFAARAALEPSSRIRSLVFISPTGLRRAAAPPSLVRRLVSAVARQRKVGQLVYRAAASRLGVWLGLQARLRGTVDRTLLRYAQTSARQPEARYAPLAWLHGELSTTHAHSSLYASLRIPTFVFHEHSRRAAYEHLAYLTRYNPFIRAHALIGTRGMPQWDRREELVATIRSFYAAIEAADDVENRIETVPVPLIPPELNPALA